MFKSEEFGRIFWVDDNYDFKSCPQFNNGTGDFDNADYVEDWDDWEGVSIKKLLGIHKACILNKKDYAGSLTLTDAHFTGLSNNE